MYENQIAFIKRRTEELSEKARLSKPPKLKISRSVKLAYTNDVLNELAIGESLLEQWQRGILDEGDVDAILAHEFGHLITYHLKSRLETFRRGLIFPSYMILLIAVLLISAFLSPILSGVAPVLSSLLILLLGLFFVSWGLFLPSILRRAYVPDELEADRNAIAFSLISAQQLADSIVKRVGMPPPKSLGAFEIVEYLESVLKHPLLYEYLHNIGFEIKRPIETKRIAAKEQ